MFRTAAARSALRRRRLPPSRARGEGGVSSLPNYASPLGIHFPSNSPPAAGAATCCVDTRGRNFCSWHASSTAGPNTSTRKQEMCAEIPSALVRGYASTASASATAEEGSTSSGGTLRRPRPKRGDQHDTTAPTQSSTQAASTSASGTTNTSDNDEQHQSSNDDDDKWSPSQEFDEILSSDGYDPQTAVDDIFVASRWNQGLGPSGEWDPAFVLDALDSYERHLRYVLHRLSATAAADGSAKKSSSATDNGNNNEEEGDDKEEEKFQSVAERIDPDPQKLSATKWLLSSNTVSRAFRSLTRSNLETYDMGRRVRALETLVGSIGLTPLTDLLSQNLLEANGKAGNVGRSLRLLTLRKSRHYAPNTYEFEHAIQSIGSAGLHLRKGRNVFLGEKDQPPLDNPTRWLDAILLNMSSRGVQLDIDTANRMLDCYASMGRSGKATHFFYDVVRDFVEDDGTYYPMRDVEGGDRHHHSHPPQDFEGKKIPERVLRDMPTFYNRKIKVQMKMRDPPPYHKVPSRVKGSLVKRFGDEEGGGITKLQQESEKSWSPGLTAAFAFADSLTHGACGHQPIALNKKSWNILIAACCNRGAIWRAMQIAEETMPNNGFEPNIYTYNAILCALSRVGDVPTMREYMVKMTNAGITPHQFTVDFLVSGHLNSGDIGGAVSIVQDMFNQHSALPPYTTHLKIIEFALANNLVYEAKRHVYFIQQLWKWKPNDSVDPNFRKVMYLTTRNPNLTKKALMKLFRYFGEELTDDDFF